MATRAQQLFDLQHIEQEIAEKEAKLRQVKASLRGSRKLAKAQHAFEKAEVAYVQARQRQRELEDELAQVEAKIKQEEARLYDGSIRNPKELSAIQQEVEHLKARQSLLSSDVLDAIEAAEHAKQARDAAATKLRTIEAEWQKRRAKLQQAEKKLTRYLTVMKKKAKHLRATLEPADLERYEYLKTRKGLPVVAPLQGEVCGVCGVAVSQQKIITVQRGELVQCGNCDRILVHVQARKSNT
nr:C4-type zinc ribbon domain-containing protein [Ardenticatena sp.]